MYLMFVEFSYQLRFFRVLPWWSQGSSNYTKHYAAIRATQAYDLKLIGSFLFWKLFKDTNS